MESEPLKSILEAAMKLPDAERAMLAEALHKSTLPPIDPEIQAAWIAECQRRVEAYRRGEMKAIPEETVRENIRRYRQVLRDAV